MKRCPECRRDYYDETLLYCLDDGNALLEGPASGDEPATAIFSDPGSLVAAGSPSEAKTAVLRARNERSIAVLPFAHLSSDPDDEYFCDGLAEELINALAQIDGLKVVARTSAFSFKGKNADVAQIGAALNVNTILEGSVRKSGDRLRITVQLINAADGYHVWSQKYDREMRDVFEMQDDITAAVVGVLRTKLIGEEQNDNVSVLLKELKHQRNDINAYHLYLRGRFFLNKFTADDAFRSVELFNQAVALEPGFALAYAGLADAHIMLTEMGPVPPHEAMPKAKEAALKALSLDPGLAEAHSSLGMVLQDYEYDFAAAEREFLHAIELSPNSPIPRQSYGILLTELERHEQAEVQFQKVFEVDPLSVVGNWIYSFCLFLARRYDDALERAAATLKLDPNFGVAYLTVAFAYQMKGEFDQSVEAYAKCSEVMGVPQNAVYIRENYADGWESFLRSMTRIDTPVSFSSYIIAVFFATLGDKDGAFAALEASLAKRESHIVMTKSDPRFDTLRDDPRFREILVAIGFAE